MSLDGGPSKARCATRDSHDGNPHIEKAVIQGQPQFIHTHDACSGYRRLLDDGDDGERLARAGGHPDQEAVLAVLNSPLESVDGLQLIGADRSTAYWP